jgi:hypothetical protein
MAGLGVLSVAVLAVQGCHGVVDPAAERAFRAGVGESTITVYPTFVRDGQDHRYDAAAAQRIANMLERRGAQVQRSEAEVPITGGWHMNEARMFRESTEALASFVRKNSIQTEYALLAEYIIGGRHVPVGIHCYAVDAEGTPALGVLLNSHFTEFSSVNPQTVNDCTDILLGVLEDRFEDVEADD